ncbi:hypothetical protein [Streptomyces johnsoniae]|uniref:Secreted protein n=1 Tax=Streptomyces johnsoniae TaxID=3075532 RepID=A0ABU2SB00_9ACTN|nr:hypothetical protein [Streptomyces sp. DSM 41886]MDT0445280.1 hypothetical protein [Streptomyces sp. DSM 41886]
MRKTRIKGIVAASIAALGLTALAVTSANASSGGGDEDVPPHGPTVPGDGPVELPENGVAVQKNEDGSMDIRELTDEEVEEGGDWQPVTPPAE